MELRNRSHGVSYVPDSDDDQSSAHSSASDHVVTSETQASRSKTSRLGSKSDPVTEGSLLRFTQPNVINTNAICISPKKTDREETSDDDFIEHPRSASHPSRRKGKASHHPRSRGLEIRKNTSRFLRVSYKEISSSSDGSSDDDLDKAHAKFSKHGNLPTHDSGAELPDFFEFAFKEKTELQKVAVPGRRRLVKLASYSPAAETPKDAQKPAALQNLEDLDCGVDAPRRSSRILSSGSKSTKDSLHADTSDHGTILKLGKNRLPKACDVVTCTSELEEESAAPETAQDFSHTVPKLEVDAFGLCTTDGSCNGSVKRVGQVERILAVKDRKKDSAMYAIKEVGKSYRRVVNVKESILLDKCPQLLRNFWKKMDDLQREGGNPGEKEDSPAFNPLYIQVDRVIATERKGRRTYYLVKWCALPYSEATWELQEDLIGDQTAIDRFLSLQSNASRAIPIGGKSRFKDGRVLRDYQEKGLAWMDHNFRSHVNCILADEMGLGKTIQAVAMLQNLRVSRKIGGPFLVIAPVSTLGHWQREVESLTDMYCVVYSGNMEDRDMIKQYEFFHPKSHEVKFNVLLTSFEMMMKEQGFLSKQNWRYIIVDEAHRLKSKDSKTTRSLRQLKVRKGGLLLLTGTPVQNSTKEIFSLLNVLDPDMFSLEEDFLLKYGDLRNAEQVRELQENILKPRLLRRMKDDVEKSIPMKEETIIWVELTKDQRCYYRAILENRISDLLKGSQSGNIPNLRNMAMELRKLCNHPFLCNGLKEDLNTKFNSSNCNSLNGEESEHRLLCQTSGKMLLLDKLLPMLKTAGHRVLIFSQFAIMLDLLENYLISKSYAYERIDGTICGSDRQAAIDRFSAKDSSTFVFLLSTRAGGVGITLTAADTCIIYDSDWNPQNDLQAMARCHRIGQTKDVRIYRLITRNTYEQHLFECSSRKYGLDEAILGGMQEAHHDAEHSKNIESLLKRGAYDILKEDGEAEAVAFHAQNIEQILESRTQKRIIGGRSNNTFSVATFVSNPEVDSVSDNQKPDLDGSSTEFWQELLPEACNTALSTDKQAQLTFGPRKRLKVNYREKQLASDAESSDEEPTKANDKNCTSRRKCRPDIEIEGDVKQWTEKELKRLENRLILLGTSRTEQIMVEAELNHRGLEEVNEVTKVIVQLCHHFQAKNTIVPSEVHSDTLGTNSIENKGECNLSADAGVDNCAPQASGWCSSTFKRCSPAPEDEIMLEGTGMLKEGKDLGIGCANEGTRPVTSVSGNTMHVSTPTFELPAFPPFCRKALSSQAFTGRLQKNATRYLQALNEREVLAKALSSAGFLPPCLQRGKKLPSWWGQCEDLDLMIGAHKHGHRDFLKIREDRTLCFTFRLSAYTSAGRDSHSQGSQSVADTATGIENTASADEENNDGWPHDSVLMSRLKKLIQALPNGLSEKDGQKKEAARKRAQEQQRVPKLSQEPKLPSLDTVGVLQRVSTKAGNGIQSKGPKKIDSNPPEVRGSDEGAIPDSHTSNSNSKSVLSVLGAAGTNSDQRAGHTQQIAEVANSSSESEGDTFQKNILRRLPTNWLLKEQSSAANVMLSGKTEKSISKHNGESIQGKKKHVAATKLSSTQPFPSKAIGKENEPTTTNVRVQLPSMKVGSIMEQTLQHHVESLQRWPFTSNKGHISVSTTTSDSCSTFKLKHAGLALNRKENDVPKRKTGSIDLTANKRLKSWDVDISKQKTLLGFLTSKSAIAQPN